MKKQIDELVGRINGKYGTINWIPVWYLSRFIPFETLVALYYIADVALITPLRDGMNLIAKEFVATKIDGKGVLVLSEMAGASKELLIEAIVVNPNNIEEVAEALKIALTMPKEEQIERNRAMQKRLQRYDIVKWANDFLEGLNQAKQIQKEFIVKKLTKNNENEIVGCYLRSNSRLHLLDYDGTLIPFSDKPEKAKPGEELIRLLKSLAKDPKNEVVIISGRDRKTLERWFGNLDIEIIAEHGVWIKEKGQWKTIEQLSNDWKDEIKPILELYVDRTPGSFIEEKDYSLVWHYRKVDPDLATARARELKDVLLHLTTNLNLEVLEGDKIIEIKNVGINKGKVALKLISKKDWNFILAIGDDRMDEDLFAVLPDNAYSIKVGFGPSRAKFNVGSYLDVRSLLKKFVKL